MSLTANDLLEIRTVVREEVNGAVAPVDGRLKAIESDVKEIYKMISGLQHSAVTDSSFKKLTIEKKLLTLNAELLEAAKLTADKKDALEEYMQARKTSFDGSLPAQAAIIATFLNDELDWQGVDHNDMYTVYSAMGWRQPGNPRSQLNNALSRNHYFDGVTDGKYLLSHRGENFARHDSTEDS